MIWNEEQNTQTQRNWFSRLARGLSSSLFGFRSARSSGNSSPSTLLKEEPEQLSSPDKTFVSIDGNNESGVKNMPSMPLPQGPFTEQSRQRLAGHTAKIRLETPTVLEPPSPMVKQMISETPREILDLSSLSSLPLALGKAETANPMVRQMISETPREILDVSPRSSFPATPDKTETDTRTSVGYPETAKQEAGPSYQPPGNSRNKTAIGDQKRLGAGRLFKGNMIVTRNPLCGSGEFHCGQSDAIIKNLAVRASSVVVVTLTSNPGPVAVHYVSLLPYESFTVHLTAPTTMHTRFNYLIFSGNLI